MFRLGAFSDDLHTDFRSAADLALHHELDGLAVRNVGGRNIVSLDLDEVRSIGREAATRGLAVASLGTQFGRGFHLDDEDAPRMARSLLESALARAALLETPLIRVFGLWLHEHDELPTWSDRPDLDHVLEPLVAGLEPFVTMAERAGAILMLELEGASFVGTTQEAERVISALDSSAVALCWDVCNGWWSGEAPLEGLARAQALPLVDVQTKDVPARADEPELPTFGRAVTGQGDIPYSKILPALVDHGYDGWITIERVHHPHKPEVDRQRQDDTVADIEGVKDILAHATRGSAHD